MAGDRPMTFRVYSGPRGSQSISPLEKDRHLYKEFSALDEAMSWARHINDSGRVSLLIEGDDGTRLTKQQIVAALKAQQVGTEQTLDNLTPPRELRVNLVTRERYVVEEADP